jgi:LPXTG-motif cell wall-anchored protein
MNGRQRRKLFAGAGIFSMLLGALMVVVPAGAGAQADDAADNPDCAEFLDDPTALQAKYDVGSVLGSHTATGAFSVDFTVTAILDEAEDTIGLRFSVTDSELPIVAARVKQAALKQGLSEQFNFNPAAIAPFSFDYLKDTEYSNVRFCALPAPPPPPPTITIVKAAVPNTVIPAGTEFDFDGPEGDFTLQVGGSDTFTEGGEYTEVHDEDYPLAYIECGELTFTDREPEQVIAAASASISAIWDEDDSIRGVDIDPGDEDVTCTFFNEGDTPPPPPSGGGGTPTVDVLPEPEVVAPASLPVVKVVDGDELAIPETWVVEIDIDGGNSTDAVLTNTTTSVTQAELDPGTYSLRELSFDDGELTAISCLADGIEVAIPAGTGLLADGVTVDLQSGDDVTCTFTNTYLAQEVLPEPEVTPPTPTPEVEPAAAVKGDVVTRTLPRTGNESRDLAGFGAGLLLLGIGLVLTSRGRYARVG